MERIPRSGELYRHFKDKLYQIVTVATHSETGEKLVIYQALYGEYRVYARPLTMFVSEVDHLKYPEVTQKYRFERVEREAVQMGQNTVPWQQEAVQTEQNAAPRQQTQEETAMYGSTPHMEKAEGETADPGLLAFLDAENMEEKYNILLSMQDRMNDQLVNSLAVSMDVVIPEGDLEERYEALKNCLRTRRRYESDRLR